MQSATVIKLMDLQQIVDENCLIYAHDLVLKTMACFGEEETDVDISSDAHIIDFI